MGAAIDDVTDFDAVSQDAATAVPAFWRQGMDRAFKTIEDMFLPFFSDRQRLVVIVPASFTFGHGEAPYLNLRSGAGKWLQNNSPLLMKSKIKLRPAIFVSCRDARGGRNYIRHKNGQTHLEYAGAG
jgi:hypothetical protein